MRVRSAAQFPSGGVAVAAPIARQFALQVLPLIARKVQVPGNTEFGMGAVAWDGRVLLDRSLIGALGLGPAAVEAQVEQARASVAERLARFLGGRPMPISMAGASSPWTTGLPAGPPPSRSSVRSVPQAPGRS